MSDFNNGTNKILYIYVDSAYVPIGCLQSNGFSEDAEMLDTTSRDNVNGWKSSVPVAQSYSISFSGLITNDTYTGTIVTYRALQEIKRTRAKITWKMNSEVTGYSEYGLGYITSLGNTANIDEFISFDGTIIGYGEPVFDTDFPAALNYDLNTVL